MRSKWLIVGMVGALGLGLAACGGDDDDDASGSPSEADGGGAAVVAQGTAFDVAGPVAAGADFTVDNNDSFAHTITADDDAFDEELDGDESISVTAPSEPGDYAFHCTIHPAMTGTLTVE